MLTDKQTNNDENITSLTEVITKKNENTEMLRRNISVMKSAESVLSLEVGLFL